MIYCENKLGRALIDDEFNVNVTNKTNLKFIKTIMNELQGKLAPENGSATYILANELKQFDFLLLYVQLPLQKQLANKVY